jgi:NAD(P)-dependent dehydrogenase (short-subunit alcohol dehydrogenase family)
MAESLKQLVVMITGAAAGLGHALAEEFARRSARLILIDLPGKDWRAAETQLRKLGATQVYLSAADVTRMDQLQEAVRDAEQAVGTIDILIANAGVGIDTPVDPLALEGIQKQIAVNLTGVANSLACVLPGMQGRRRGQLVAIASLAGYRGLPGLDGYCASKAGVIALMDSMRLDLRKFGIICTIICPGWINTGVMHNLTSVKPGITDLPVAARKIARAIERKKPFLAFPSGCGCFSHSIACSRPGWGIGCCAAAGNFLAASNLRYGFSSS